MGLAQEAEERIVEVWRNYKSAPSDQLREELLLHYAPVVRFVGQRLAKTLPQSVDAGDLAGYGLFGLMDAIEKFDPDMGFKFETYAVNRIRGHIIDELRAVDWVPRSVRTKSRNLDRARDALANELHRPPTDKEVAEELGVDLETHATMSRQAANARSMGSLDERRGSSDDDDEASLGERLIAAGDDPLDAFEFEQLSERIVQAMETPSTREQAVLVLYYIEGFTLAQIGDLIGVTESRVCQIHTKAILNLQSWMEPTQRRLPSSA